MDLYRVSTVDVPESPIASCARGPWQQRCDSLHCYEEWSSVVFSWTLDEGGAAETCNSTQHLPLPWRYSVVYYYPIIVIRHNEHHLHSTLCRAHFLWTRRTVMLPFIWLAFQVWFLWTRPSFVNTDDSSKNIITFPLVPVQQGLCDSIAVPLLHLGNFTGCPMRCKFAVTQNIVQNVEQSLCGTLLLPLLTHAQFIGAQQRTGKQGVELYCSPRVLVLYWGCPERHPYLFGTL